MELNDYRERIDKIDAVIVEKFQERMRVAGEIAEFKKEHDMPVKFEEREKEVIEKAVAMAEDDMATYCRMLYNNIMEMSKDYQRKVMKRGEDFVAMLEESRARTPDSLPENGKVACHGGQEPYCRQACMKLFGNDDNIQYFEDLDSIFDAVISGECRYAVLTVGKSIESSNKVYEMLSDRSCYIVRSVMTAGGIRFVCISRELEIYPNSDKSCLMLRIPDVPGALYGVLDKFYALGINISKLRSWQAPDSDADLMFCFDVEVPFETVDFKSLMSQISHAEQEYVYLGSYMEI